jgi:hypothetical protein
MKSVLYVAAALMVGASIYGFVDYSKTKGIKEFETMYDKKKTENLVLVEEREPTSNEIQVSKKEKTETINKETVKAEKVNKETAKKKPVSKFKKKRKINYKSFSRAPLVEEEEIIELPEIKKL